MVVVEGDDVVVDDGKNEDDDDDVVVAPPIPPLLLPQPNCNPLLPVPFPPNNNDNKLDCGWVDVVAKTIHLSIKYHTNGDVMINIAVERVREMSLVMRVRILFLLDGLVAAVC